MTNDQYIEITDTMVLKDFISLFNSTEKLSDWFTTKELEKFDFHKKPESFACRYLAKKIIQKEFYNEIRPLDIEILNNKLGKPGILMSDYIQQMMKIKKISKIICSLSHSHLKAAAMVVFEKG